MSLAPKDSAKPPTSMPPTVVPPQPPKLDPPTENLIQVLEKAGNFKQLIKIITNNNKLAEQINSIDAKTIFAPNDAAFDKVVPDVKDPSFEKLTDAEKSTFFSSIISR